MAGSIPGPEAGLFRIRLSESRRTARALRVPFVSVRRSSPPKGGIVIADLLKIRV